MTTETNTECSMIATPQKEHEWLQKLVGDWTWEGECDMGPDQPPWKSTGTERVRSLGGLWTVGESTNRMPDKAESSTTLMTLGYDPQKNTFVGTFVASIMTHLWVYEHGELDASGRALHLYAQGPSMAPGSEGKMAQYRDSIEFKSDDHRVLTSHVQGEDGQWTHFMTAHYRRAK